MVGIAPNANIKSSSRLSYLILYSPRLSSEIYTSDVACFQPNRVDLSLNGAHNSPRIFI
ncbi:hypothetical protein CBM2633_P210012 [Cupriavidus taiwanensis]|uniref:Uncharacterized protein n=2 Tax=Cupriavidus TaxID=106589 RepID=A0A375CQU5_9BURK|nr:hypothetical protein CBM2588_P230012 [Cupriavidus taiwanensis]SOZ40488.1 hypothetical protein CBM2605_P210015 [Cupriavidus neocaledonicus]SOY74918.1 hypothetical protein CBM2585_P210012 [Cupriavidus taiwanensis]SOY77786.1 hypothetical protein CBM2586_P210013 [Cupriavidus taiwanensis]SOY99500.1 hypothetical protein CBM2591_P240012 [Cupriavidus taiwanensis]